MILGIFSSFESGLVLCTFICPEKCLYQQKAYFPEHQPPESWAI
jgi:hypothetical protein